LAAAILAAAQERRVGLSAVEAFQSLTGKGVSGTLNGMKAAIGNSALMSNFGAPSQILRQRAEALQAEGQTVMYVASDARSGLIAVSDPLKDQPPMSSSS